MSGTLYIVATPIGNLADITLRALEVLKTVDVIASEDTRTTKKLLTHYDIHTPLTAYFEHNEAQRSSGLIEQLKSGKNIALVSEAGTPSISDPGYRLLSLAREEGVEVVPIPGASAVITALSASGLPTDRFLFVGFLPDKEVARRKKLEALKDFDSTMIFYISKWKVERVLNDMIDIFGDRKVCYTRELTKLHEEILRCNLSEVIAHIKGKEVKGEITLVVEGL